MSHPTKVENKTVKFITPNSGQHLSMNGFSTQYEWIDILLPVWEMIVLHMPRCVFLQKQLILQSLRFLKVQNHHASPHSNVVAGSLHFGHLTPDITPENQEVCQPAGFSLFQLSSHQRYYYLSLEVIQCFLIHELLTLERWCLKHTCQAKLQGLGLLWDSPTWNVKSFLTNSQGVRPGEVAIMDWNFTCHLISLQHQVPRFRYTTSSLQHCKTWEKGWLQCTSHQWMLPFMFQHCWHKRAFCIGLELTDPQLHQTHIYIYERLSKPLLTLKTIHHLRFPIAFSNFGVLGIRGHRSNVLATCLLHLQCLRSCCCHCC